MVTFKESGGVLRCTFKGRMDTPACQEIEPQVMAKINAATGYVVFDLMDVNYISSMFFRLCIQVRKEVDTGMFSIENAQPEVKNVFKIAGLSQMLNVQ